APQLLSWRPTAFERRLVRDAVRAALRVAGGPSSLRRVESLRRRAHTSAALPELRLRAERSTDESLRLTPTQSDPYRYTRAGGVGLSFEAQLTWRLDRLLFAMEELSIERLRAERHRDLSGLVERVVKTVVSWQRARLEADDPLLTPEQRASLLLDAFQAEALLDVMTGGWFGAAIDAEEAQSAKTTNRSTSRAVPLRPSP
ncbi:MAG TPA: hypothetical protein VGJ84_14500, partial [Polyangiaceae bacterium]